jgi:FkbM family methyltransferase
MANAVRRARRAVVRRLPTDRRVKGLGGAKGRGWLQARKLVAPFYQRPVTLQTPDGLRLHVSADPVDEQIAQHVLGPRRREYFPPWPDGVARPQCVLDVGAHHGLYAAAALREYPGARIVCVEPSASALALLRTNLDINGVTARARIAPVGLAPAAGTGVLRHSVEGSWGSSLYEDPAQSTGSEDVRLATLAEVLGDDVPDVVKCNAEGAEYTLLEQLDASGIRPALMIVMVHPDFGDMPALLDRARAMGYSITEIGTAGHPAFQMWRT